VRKIKDKIDRKGGDRSLEIDLRDMIEVISYPQS